MKLYTTSVSLIAILQKFYITRGVSVIFVLMVCSSFNFANSLFPHSEMIEICDNGIDDDGDNLIDLNDNDCDCPVIEPKSLISNPSFEEQDCCPQNRAELYCATGWIQASAPTTDFLHTCGWEGPNEYEPPIPFPDGNGIMGFRDGRVGRQGDGENLNWKRVCGSMFTESA